MIPDRLTPRSSERRLEEVVALPTEDMGLAGRPSGDRSLRKPLDSSPQQHPLSVILPPEDQGL
jgi:hypothetical protein